jgi:hypothetical protein
MIPVAMGQPPARARPDVWVARDDGTEIIRARETTAVNLDYDGNVTARLAGGRCRAGDAPWRQDTS